MIDRMMPTMPAAAAQDRGSAWDPEYELLLCIARKDLDPETGTRIESVLEQPLRWDLLIDRAKRHGLSSFLYTHLNTQRPGVVPAETLETLRQLQINIAKRNFFLAGKLCGLLDLLSSEGIAVLPFKGPALGLALYGDLTLRTSFDLDILVREADILRAKQLLVREGFELDPRMTPRQESEYRQSQCQHIFNHPTNGIHLELHWAVAPSHFSIPLDLGAVWQSARELQTSFQPIRVLPPEELLLALCVHGTKHVWDRLLLICDVAQLLRTYADLNWSRLLHLADACGGRRVLFLGLFLAGEWLSAPVPEEIRKEVLLDRSIPGLAHEVAREYRGSPNISVLRFYDFQLRAREHGGDRFRVVSRLFFQPTAADWERLPLPDTLFPLYYVVRPLRLLGRFAIQPWRRIAKA